MAYLTFGKSIKVLEFFFFTLNSSTGMKSNFPFLFSQLGYNVVTFLVSDISESNSQFTYLDRSFKNLL